MPGDLMRKDDWLSIIFPTDNMLGIPTLLEDMQAPGVVAPLNVWGGRHGRTKLTRLGGTVCFYTEDYRFNALLTDPTPVSDGRFACAVEPNVSVFAGMPPAVAAERVYRKRWVARFWQERGLRVLVDLNVAPEYAELNLLGVPEGWNAYATRGYTDRLAYTVAEHELAKRHAGHERPLFLVYGGGRKVREAALHYGWTWLPEDVDVQKGRNNGLLPVVEQLALGNEVPRQEEAAGGE